ncbi:MAG TPA: PAS domain S-box protein [Syntrophorhabdaceae bacterium]|nr:PAS domain S-box protein [Syntrophorhabdaceae bacterium]HQM82526.1 PAS domain S-box protein [Syntrophorhabdaceae bacterium]
MTDTACGINFYNWDIQTGNFIIDDYAGALGASTEGMSTTRQSWEALFHPEDKDRVLEAFQLYFKKNNPTFEIEYRVLTNTTSYKWFMDRGKIVERNQGGKPCKVKGVLIDTSNRKSVEEILEKRNTELLTALQKSEDEKWAILNGLQDFASVHYVDPHLRMIWDSKFMDKRLNIKGNSTQNCCYEIIHGRTEPCEGCTAIRALETGEVHKAEAKLSDGRTFITIGNPIKDNTGLILGVMQITLNITKHKQAEAGLQTTSKLLHSLLENSPTPIYVSDIDGRIDTVNRAWEKTFGFKHTQVTGRSFYDIFTRETADQINSTNEKLLQMGISTEFEESINCPTGLHYFHTVKFPLSDETGKKVAVGVISVDVTTRKNIEKELKKHETELRIKSQQLEEINTALRVLLRQREEDQRELEERIVSNVRELVLPYVDKLKGMHLSATQMSYLEIVETHLNDIITPFLRQMVSDYPHMTAKELKVATLVKEGKTNKEMADLMNVSVNAIEIHRYNLRKKLDLQNKKINLRSYLLSLKKLPS